MVFSPEDLCKNIHASLSSFPHRMNPKCRGWATDTCIFKSCLGDFDFKRGLRINPYRWSFWESEELSHLSKVAQQVCGRPMEGDNCMVLSTGKGLSSGFQRHRSQSCKFLLWPRCPSFHLFPIPGQHNSSTFCTHSWWGFLLSPSSSPQGLERVSMEEIAANPRHTSASKIHGKGETVHLDVIKWKTLHLWFDLICPLLESSQIYVTICFSFMI